MKPKMQFIFSNFSFVIEKVDENKVFCQCNWQKDAPATLADVDPDFGCGTVAETPDECFRWCICTYWSSCSLQRAVELASALMGVGLIANNFKICEYAAIIDGIWYFSYCDELCKELGLHAWNSHTIRNNINSFSEEGRRIALEIISNALHEQIEMNEQLDELYE